MSIEVQGFEATASLPESIGGLDLFALGRRASAARDARVGRRGSFVRARQLLATGAWRGPRDAAEAFIEETDFDLTGGWAAVRSAGVGLFVAATDSPHARAAAQAGLRVLLRLPYRAGEDEPARLERLAALAELPFATWGVMPAPVGEAYGLDTLRLFALCRLALPRVAHLLADVGALGPRLAQMAFGFGADELFAPIVAERALRLGANAHNPSLTRKEAATLIRGAGLLPCERLADGVIEEVTT
ncbi:MAG TPA: hypothetical protein VFG23_09525 [Polyangia bacterium]|nr:hypothetical protein [Polyangia bacterium]